MTDETQPPAVTFFLALVAFGMLAFPLVATLDSAVFDGRLAGLLTPVISLFVAILPALEFAFSDRDPYRVGWYVGAFIGVYFLVIVGQAAVYVSVGRTEPEPAVEVAGLLLTYAVAYLLVYRGLGARLKAALTR